MQKDVIYIDTEDDITAIIAKVKASHGKVVALVPPKRVGAIQSAVNLKLVHRVSGQANKHLVIVTNNQALSALAASAGIPVAKNLESRPEMPELTALEVDDDDIIDGSEIPAGSGRAAVLSHDTKIAPSAEAEDISVSELEGGEKSITSSAPDRSARAKVPDFSAFRKKLFLGLAGLVAVTAFLVWAIVFAPQTSISIKAKTTTSALNSKVTAGAALVTSLKDGTVKAELKTAAKDVSVPFTATGKKDAGTKATGTVSFSTSQISALGTTIPAGTELSTPSGATYVTDTAVTMGLSNYTGASVGITAVANGESYNGATGQLSGAPAGISAVVAQSTTGGTSKNIIVVQQSDIDAVSSGVVQSSDSEAAKKSLKSQFSDGYIVIEDTFKVDASAVKPSPAVDAESTDGKGALGGKITYSIMAVPRSEAEKYLNAYFAQQIDGRSNQKVYDNGLSSVSLGSSVAASNNYAITITANGKIGPKIDENDVKSYAKGKKAGEIRAYLEAVNGVDGADVKMSPFWVTTAPGDINKIKVTFTVNG